ncbi:N-acetyltransferase [Pseudomonas monteilii]|nr:N-acetyltransferase [Pseudomonas monteilii]
MADFDPLTDYYHRRQAALLDHQAHVVQLVTTHSAVVPGSFFDPAPTFTAVIEHQAQTVGEICYAVSPLRDRLYIDELAVAKPWTGRGFAQAALWRLWRVHQVPLTPLMQRMDSLLFRATVRRRFAAAGVTLTQDLRNEEQEAEQQRWQHLVPESAMDRSIRRYWAWVAAEQAAGRRAGPGVR